MEDRENKDIEEKDIEEKDEEINYKEINYKEKTFNCTFELTLELIGGKWKPIILWHLSQYNSLRFSELKRTMPRVTQKMLTQQLRELEEDKLVNRKVYAEVPPKVEYTLTETGKSLIPLLQVMDDWGKDYSLTIKNTDFNN